MIYYAVGAFAITLFNCILFIFTYRRRLTPSMLAYFQWSFFVSAWSLGYGITLGGFFDYQTTLLWNKFCQAMAALIGPFFFKLSICLSDQYSKKQKTYFIYLGLGILVSLLLFSTDWFIAGLWSFHSFKYQPSGGPFYSLFVFFFLWCNVHGFITVFQRYGKSEGLERKKNGLFLIATGIGYGLSAELFLQGFKIPVDPHGVFFMFIYVVILGYAIFRYRIMDIQLVVTRTGIFALIYCLIIGAPAFLIFQMRDLLERQLGVNWWLLPAGLFSLLSFMGPFVYLLLQRKAEAVLLREQKAYQQTLLQASRGMTLIKDLDHLLKLMTHILTKTVRITHARIFLWDNNTKNYICKAVRGDQHKIEDDVVAENAALIRQLHADKTPLLLEEVRSRNSSGEEVAREMDALCAALIVPSFVQDRLLGFVVLGDKKSKRLYTESDLDTLATLANQAALAIENCVFLTAFEHQQTHFFQTAKMADLGTMASGIAHQVNNRFNVIKLGAESALMVEFRNIGKLLEAKDIDAIRKITDSLAIVCQKIAKSADHGGEIVRRLLDFSRLSEGFKPVSIQEAATSCIRLWECKRTLSGIDFRIEIPDGLVKVQGNFSEIEEMLFNLMDNAFDALKMKEEAWAFGSLEKPKDPPVGSIVLSAKETYWRDKRCVEIVISDTGLGMTDVVKKQIFIPFFTTKATSIKGTGLGLYVIRRMVDAHQGDIVLESEHGKGTTFHVFIPAVAEA